MNLVVNKMSWHSVTTQASTVKVCLKKFNIDGIRHYFARFMPAAGLLMSMMTMRREVI